MTRSGGKKPTGKAGFERRTAAPEADALAQGHLGGMAGGKPVSLGPGPPRTALVLDGRQGLYAS